MIQSLFIRNYALIQEVNINLNKGLSVITGETGAGKSILLGALALAAGKRADNKALLNNTEKCVVELCLSLEEKKLEAFFKENELDYHNDCIIRREISKDGRSRAFINDTPVTLNLLKELTEALIDIHSQHETLLLNKSAFQLQLVDAFAGNQTEVREYRNDFEKLQQLKAEYKKLVEGEQLRLKEQDYLQFQFNELEGAKLDELDQEALEKEHKLLSSSESITQQLQGINSKLDGNEQSLINELNSIKNELSRLSSFGKDFEEVYKRFNSCAIELSDLSYELSRLQEGVAFDPNRQQLVEDSLDKLYSLQKKHGVNTVEQLLELKEHLLKQLNEFAGADERTKLLKAEVSSLEKQLLSKAEAISKKRQKVIPKIEKEVKSLLNELAMPNAIFNISCIKEEAITPNGLDSINFLFNANKGGLPTDISKVASGGELSRLMLALKAVAARYSILSTIIFDEIDTGVSGEVAHKMAELMKKISADQQVVSITHLPQIASAGQTHYRVFKHEKGGKTNTFVSALSKDERIEEIAKMLSAGEPSKAAVQNAKELLEVAGK